MAAYKLLLCPRIIDCPGVTPDALAETLHSIGLIGKAFRHRDEVRYEAGQRFFQLLTFLGCSPAIEIELPIDPSRREAACAEGHICHIRLFHNANSPSFRVNRHITPPRCPQCRKPEPQWQELINTWRSDPEQTAWNCSQCGHQGRVYDLNFRKTGAFGRVFVEIWGIYPSEAVPGEALLNSLGALNHCPWNYFYVQD